MSSRLQDLDSQLSSRVRVTEEPGLQRTLAVVLAHSGDSWFWIPALGIVYLIGNPDWKERALAMLIGVLITAVVVTAVKFTIRRQRPEGEWGGVYRKADPHSFPSGHAARGACLMTLAIGMGPAWFALALLVWAPLMALSRVRMGLHYVSDILGGMLFGIVIAILVLRFYVG
ncbi:MAG TPA: phosphatase PAP2 family protein [Anaerolineales bacterium]|nr:phosphatase PAP2 family protein [Anaerolineales bacterium]